MSTTSTDAAFAAVRAADPGALCRDGTMQLLRDVRRLRAWLDTVEMDAARRLRELSAVGQAEPPDALIAEATGVTGRDAHAVGDRSDLCDEAPNLGDALADGDLTAAHLDAINAAAKGLPDEVRTEFLDHSDDLLRRAERLGLEAFARECRRLAKHLLAQSRSGSDADELEAQRAASKVSRWVDQHTGMHHTQLSLDPLRDAALAAAFNAELARLRAVDGNGDTPWQQLQVDAFVNAVCGVRTTNRSEAASHGADDPVPARRVDRVPEVTMLVSYDWLAGFSDDGVCETDNGEPLPISTARRLCCDAEIIPTLLGSEGEVLDQGRSTRTATVPQRRALRAMHRGCAFPGCGVGFDACRIHHVRWWWRDTGPSDIENLIPVCERHHHLIHEGGWELHLTPDRRATWTRPDGVVHFEGSAIDRRPREEETSSTTHRRDAVTHCVGVQARLI